MNIKNIKEFLDSIIKFIHNYQTFLKNTTWTTINQVITVVLGILLSVVFARFTSKELFGEYNFLISVVAMVSIVTLPGLNTSMLRSVSRGMDGVYEKAVKLSFLWSLLGSPILFVIGFYYYFFNNQIIGLSLFITTIFFPLLYAPNNWISLLQGKKRFDIFAKYSIIQIIIKTSLIIITILSEPTNLLLIFISFLIGGAATNILFYYKSKKYVKNDSNEDGWEKSGFKLTLNDFVLLSYDNVDKILIGIFLGPTELAVYVIAVSVVTAIKGSLIQIIKVIFPSIFAMTKIELRKILKNTLPILAILNTSFILLIILALPFLMNLLYSQRYADSIFYAQIYSIIIPLTVLTVILTTALISLKEENIILISRILGFVLLITLYIILIPNLGIIGAILTSLVYYICLCIFLYYYLVQRLNVSVQE